MQMNLTNSDSDLFRNLEQGNDGEYYFTYQVMERSADSAHLRKRKSGSDYVRYSLDEPFPFKDAMWDLSFDLRNGTISKMDIQHLHVLKPDFSKRRITKDSMQAKAFLDQDTRLKLVLESHCELSHRHRRALDSFEDERAAWSTDALPMKSIKGIETQPMEKYENQRPERVTPAERVIALLRCFRTRNDMYWSDCMKNMSLDARHDLEVREEMITRLCSWHIDHLDELLGILSGVQNMHPAQRCIARHIHNSTIYAQAKEALIQGIHTDLNPHEEFVDAVHEATRVEKQKNATLRHIATLAVGSTAFNLRESRPHVSRKLLKFLHDRLHRPDHRAIDEFVVDGDNHTYHTMHVRALGNAAHCRSLSLIMRFVNHSHGHVRLGVLSALRHLNCAAAEHILRKHLWHPNITDEERAEAVISLKERHNEYDLTGETLDHLQQHAYAEIGSDSKTEQALDHFYESSAYVPVEHYETWRQMKASGAKAKNNLMRFRRRRRFIDWRKFLRPLVDIRFGKGKKYEKKYGVDTAGAKIGFKFNNYFELYVSLMDGRVTIDIDNNAYAEGFVLGKKLEFIFGQLAFKAGFSYKNTAASDLVEKVWKVAGKVLRGIKSITDRLLGAAFKFIGLLKRYIKFLTLLANNPLTMFGRQALPFIMRADLGIAFAKNATIAQKGLTQQAREMLKFIPMIEQLRLMNILGGKINHKSAQLKALGHSVDQFQADNDIVINAAAKLLRTIQGNTYYSSSLLPLIRRTSSYVQTLSTQSDSAVKHVSYLPGKVEPINGLINRAKSFRQATAGYELVGPKLDTAENSLLGLKANFTKFIENFLSRPQGLVERDGMASAFNQQLNSANATFRLTDKAVGDLETVARSVLNATENFQTVNPQMVQQAARALQQVNSHLTQLSRSISPTKLRTTQQLLSSLSSEIDRTERKLTAMSVTADQARRILKDNFTHFLGNSTQVITGLFYDGQTQVNIQGLVTDSFRHLRRIESMAKKLKEGFGKKLRAIAIKFLQDMNGFEIGRADSDFLIYRYRKVIEWVMNRVPFVKAVGFARDIFDSIGHFVQRIPYLKHAGTLLRSYVKLVEGVVGMAAKMDSMTSSLDRVLFASIEEEQALKMLLIAHAKIKDTKVSPKAELANAQNVLGGITGSIPTLKRTSKFVRKFNADAKIIGSRGFSRLMAVIKSAKTTLAGLRKSVVDTSDFVKTLGSGTLHKDAGVLIKDTESLRNVFAVYTSFRAQVLTSSLAASGVIRLSKSYALIKTRVQNMIEDHAAQLEEYDSFVCVPGALCVTRLLRDDINIAIQGLDQLRSLLPTARSFLDKTVPSLINGADKFSSSLGGVPGVKGKCEGLLRQLKSIQSTIALLTVTPYAKRAKQLEDYGSQLTTATPRTIAHSLKKMVGSKGMGAKIRVFSEHIRATCTTAGKIVSIYYQPLKWGPVLVFVKNFNKFAKSAIFKEMSQSARQMTQTRAAVRKSRKIMTALNVIDETTATLIALPRRIINFVRNIIHKVQWHSRHVDKSKFAKAETLRYCSQDLCLRQVERSSKVYRDYVFPLKFIHFKTLSKRQAIIPGLFENYQTQGVCQLAGDVHLLTMYGTGELAAAAPLIVAFNMKTRKVVKMFTLSQGADVLKSTRFGCETTGKYLFLFGNYIQTPPPPPGRG